MKAATIESRDFTGTRVAGGGVEIELKFQVPPSARAGVRKALAGATAQTLRAGYADTADARLAAAGFALRLRREGRRWVQTLKGRGDDLLTRLEHELPLANARGTPVIDWRRHAGTPAGEALARLLVDGAPLVERYRTEVRRSAKRVRSGGAVIEIAFDEGRIVAGAGKNARTAAVCELEFELISGPPAALVALAARWAQRHGLWLDSRPKSLRGQRLAEGAADAPPVRAQRVEWKAIATPAEAIAAMLRQGLAHALPNAAELAAAGSGRPEHVHQLRVAIRRLRTALRLFGRWSVTSDEAAALEAAWREPFERLGQVRDTDVLAAFPGLATLLPALSAQPGSHAAQSAAAVAPADPGAVVRDPGFTGLALRTLALALAPLPALEDDLRASVNKVIARAWRSFAADVPGFATASVPLQHRTRKRLKRLRYATEFVLPLLPPKRAARALAAMREALELLGQANDRAVAEARLAPWSDQAPVAYQLGRLGVEREQLTLRAGKRLAQLVEDHRGYWR